MLVRSIYCKAGPGKLPNNPVHFASRYVLKYVAHALALREHNSLTDMTHHL